MAAYNIYEAKTGFSALVDKAEKGEEVIIARAGKPVAKLVALREVPPKSGAPKQYRNSFGANYAELGEAVEALDQPWTDEEQRAFGMID